MAKVTLNSAIMELYGTLDGFVFRRTPSGRTIISKKPDMSRVRHSPAQKHHQQKFKQAVAHAQIAMLDPEMREHYVQEAKLTSQIPFCLAVSGYFRVQKLQVD